MLYFKYLWRSQSIAFESVCASQQPPVLSISCLCRGYVIADRN